MDEFPIGNIKGKDAEIEEVTASVDNTSGEPSVTVTASGTPNKRKFHFAFSGLKGNTGEQGAAAINDEEIPINEQIPTYTEATDLAPLTSGEKISVAFGKIKKAVSVLISHIADNTIHGQAQSSGSIATGTYTGDNVSEKFIETASMPKAVIVMTQYGGTLIGTLFYGGLATPESQCIASTSGEPVVKIGEQDGKCGFFVYKGNYSVSNYSGVVYNYVAFL